jgi:hypothetical protein
MQQNEQIKKPFFANFLESQKTQQDQQGVYEYITKKIRDDFEQTQKYPSDGDEV